ncbi:hypothetical protein BLNAU_8554 [Blattamonas nauphoetae]|uniref:Uncharacterized protein n=1 Tax=Blattamonas nauphoetae TaxID=2049346 RepID=A0ABQ9XYG6_9EUKA|nr:hypothetical protein BLNAU_8554 [Blattamonas nauphoetae]
MPRRRSRSPTKSKSILYKGKVQNDSPAVFPRTYTKSTSPKRRNILSRTLQNDHILPDGSYLDSSTKSVLIFEFPDKPPDSSPFLPLSPKQDYNQNTPHSALHHPSSTQSRPFDPSAFQLPQDTQRSVDGDLRVRRVTVSTPSVPLAVSDARPSESNPLSIAPISTRRTLTSSNIHNATRQSRIVRSPPQLADGSNVSMAPSQDITVSTTQRSLEAQHPLKLTDLDVDQNQSSDQPEMHNVKTPPIASKDPSPQTPPQKNDFVLASITETVKRLIMSSTTHFSEKEEYGTRDDQTQSQKVSADQSVRTDVNDSEFRDQHHSNDPSQREDFRQDSHHSFSLTNHPQSLPKPAFSSTSQITSTPLSPRSLPPHPKPLSISSYSQTVPPLQLHTLTSPSDLNFSHSNLTSIQQASTHHTQFPPTISDEYGRMGGTDEANRRYLHSEDGSGIDQEIHSRHLTDQSTVSHSLPTDAGHSHNQQDMNRQQKYLIPEPQARSNSTRSCPGSNSSDRSSSPVDDSIPATATQPAHPLIPPLRLPPSPSADVDTSVFHSQQQTYTSSGVNRSSSSYYNPPPSKSLPITSDYQPTLVFTSQPHQQQFPAHSHPIKPPPSPSSLLSSGKPSKRSQNGEKEDFAHV